MKRGAIKRLLLLLLLIPAAYILVQLALVLDRPFRTETAIQYTLADSLTLDGVLCFEEQPVPGGGNLGYLVASGERVSAGAPVAEVYTDSAQSLARARIKSLTRQIELLSRSQNTGGTDITLQQGEMQSAVYDLLDEIDRQSYEGLQEGKEEYLLAANKLQITTGRVDSFSGQIAALQEELAAATAQLGSPQTITAPASGYFVAAQDTAFLTASAEILAAQTPAELAAMLAQGAETVPQELAGKVVTSYSWHYYGICPIGQSDKFTEGARVEISFPGRADQPRPALVEAVQPDEAAGVARVVLSCEYMGADLLALGHQEAQVDFTSYEGLRISADALHIVDGQRGVYVKYGSLSRFRKIEVLYENEDYILAPLGGKVGTDNELRMYDEVIVEGAGLRDGGLV